MAASVRVEDDAFKDERFEVLAALAGLVDADHARGKMVRLWRQCTVRGTHCLPELLVYQVLGKNGVKAVVDSELGELENGLVRIRGTGGRIELNAKLKDNGKKGGLAKARRLLEKNLASASKKPSKRSAIRVSSDSGSSLLFSEENSPSGASSETSLEHVRAELARLHAAKNGGPPTPSKRSNDRLKALLKLHGSTRVLEHAHVLFNATPSWVKPPITVGTLFNLFDSLSPAAAQAAKTPLELQLERVHMLEQKALAP